MPGRHFDCPHCGEKLQFGAAVCDSCGRSTPDWNRRSAYRGLKILAGFLVGLVCGLWFLILGGD